MPCVIRDAEVWKEAEVERVMPPRTPAAASRPRMNCDDAPWRKKARKVAGPANPPEDVEVEVTPRDGPSHGRSATPITTTRRNDAEPLISSFDVSTVSTGHADVDAPQSSIIFSQIQAAIDAANAARSSTELGGASEVRLEDIMDIINLCLASRSDAHRSPPPCDAPEEKGLVMQGLDTEPVVGTDTGSGSGGPTTDATGSGNTVLVNCRGMPFPAIPPGFPGILGPELCDYVKYLSMVKPDSIPMYQRKAVQGPVSHRSGSTAFKCDAFVKAGWLEDVTDKFDWMEAEFNWVYHDKFCPSAFKAFKLYAALLRFKSSFEVWVGEGGETEGRPFGNRPKGV